MECTVGDFLGRADVKRRKRLVVRARDEEEAYVMVRVSDHSEHFCRCDDVTQLEKEIGRRYPGHSIEVVRGDGGEAVVLWRDERPSVFDIVNSACTYETVAFLYRYIACAGSLMKR